MREGVNQDLFGRDVSPVYRQPALFKGVGGTSSGDIPRTVGCRRDHVGQRSLYTGEVLVHEQRTFDFGAS